MVKNTFSPHWNHTFVWNDVTPDDLREMSLELTVWDHDLISANDFMGGVRLNLGTGARRDVTQADDSRIERVHDYLLLLQLLVFYIFLIVVRWVQVASRTYLGLDSERNAEKKIQKKTLQKFTNTPRKHLEATQKAFVRGRFERN